MRRLKFNPFEKPVNFGEFYNQQERYVLDKPLEEGLYLFYVDNDAAGETSFMGIISFKKNAEITAPVFSSSAGQIGGAVRISSSGQIDFVGDYSDYVHEERLGSIIYLYKLA